MTTPRRGFTLIEMIVSVAIFAIVMVAVAGAYINLINLDRQTRGIDNLVNNLAFALDSMSRNIRTGTDYCGADTQGCFSNQFAFTDSNDCITSYSLYQGELVESTKPGTYGTCSVTSNVKLTDLPITINNLTFIVSGQVPHDALQPIVTFSINGTLPTSSGQSVGFTIETTSAQRSIDL